MRNPEFDGVSAEPAVHPLSPSHTSRPPLTRNPNIDEDEVSRSRIRIHTPDKVVLVAPTT